MWAPSLRAQGHFWKQSWQADFPTDLSQLPQQSFILTEIWPTPLAAPWTFLGSYKEILIPGLPQGFWGRRGWEAWALGILPAEEITLVHTRGLEPPPHVSPALALGNPTHHLALRPTEGHWVSWAQTDRIGIPWESWEWLQEHLEAQQEWVWGIRMTEELNDGVKVFQLGQLGDCDLPTKIGSIREREGLRE